VSKLTQFNIVQPKKTVNNEPKTLCYIYSVIKCEMKAMNKETETLTVRSQGMVEAF
jgi:hypothetical protein